MIAPIREENVFVTWHFPDPPALYEPKLRHKTAQIVREKMIVEAMNATWHQNVRAMFILRFADKEIREIDETFRDTDKLTLFCQEK